MRDISPRLCQRANCLCMPHPAAPGEQVSMGPVFSWVESKSRARRISFVGVNICHLEPGTHLDKVTTGLQIPWL